MAAYEHFAQVAGDAPLVDNQRQPGQNIDPYAPWWKQALQFVFMSPNIGKVGLSPQAKAWMNPEHVAISPSGKVTPGPGLTPPGGKGWIPGATVGGGASGVGAVPAVDTGVKKVGEAVQAITPSSWLPGVESWLAERGKVVGIYGLFLVVAIIGLIFLLSAAGQSSGAKLALKALA